MIRYQLGLQGLAKSSVCCCLVLRALCYNVVLFTQIAARWQWLEGDVCNDGMSTSVGPSADPRTWICVSLKANWAWQDTMI